MDPKKGKSETPQETTNGEKKIELKSLKDVRVYLNPEKSGIFRDDLSGIRLGFLPGWESDIVLPEIPEEKLSVIRKAIEHELILLEKPRINKNRKVLVEEDPEILGQAMRNLVDHEKLIIPTLATIKSKDLLLSMVNQEKLGQNRKTLLQAIMKRIDQLEGGTVIENSEVEEQYRVTNITEPT